MADGVKTREELVHRTDDQRVNNLSGDSGSLQPESAGVANRACLSDRHDDV
jgi:hypothetical protein